MIVLSIIIILWSIYMIISGDYLGILFLIAGILSFWNNIRKINNNDD